MIQSRDGGANAMVLKAAAREARSQPLASGDQGVMVGVPEVGAEVDSRSSGACHMEACHRQAAKVRRRGRSQESQHRRTGGTRDWTQHMEMVPIQGF
jgi:hypothetical protein